MKLRDRIGIDLSRDVRIEGGVEWAARNEVRFHYTNAFGTLEDRLHSRDYLVEQAREAGVHVD